MIADYNVYEPARKEKILMTIGLFLAMAMAGYIFYGTFLFALLTPCVYRRAAGAYCRYRAEKRKSRLLIQFRDFLFSLSSSFATGRHMEEAMEEGILNLKEVYGEKCLLAEELTLMLRRMRQTGETDIGVWEAFAAKSGLEDAADFTQVFRACRETGGNMIRAVNKAASVIGEKISVETEIKTMISQKKLEGRIITAMPVGIVIFLQAVSPDYLSVMYCTFAGRILMSAALLTVAGAYVLIERITSIEV